ncbi:MAG: NAD-dependent epimerase/dehydratase family protein, partial [Bryobacteraceae bacterium]
KAVAERALLRLHHRTGFPVVTLRPPFVYGPGNPLYREAFFWDRLRDGRPIILPGDGHRLMQFVYVKDLVQACVGALTAADAPGEAFNVANDRPLTQFELVLALAAAAGKKANIVRVPRERIVEAGGNAMTPPLYFGVYYDLPAITEAVGKAKRILGFQPTPFEKGLKETYRWWTRHSKRSRIDYSFEDRLIALGSSALAAD